MCRRPPRKYAVFAERISRASKQPVYLRHKAGRGRGATSDEDTGIRFNVCIVDRGDDHRTKSLFLPLRPSASRPKRRR